MPEIPEAEKKLLSELGFLPQAGTQEKLYSSQVDKETIASVDYRKVNGRRFARRNGEFVDDSDSIEILKKFKEEKDKLQLSSTEQIPKGEQTRPAGAQNPSWTTDKPKLSTHDTSKSSNHIDVPGETKGSPGIGEGNFSKQPLVPPNTPPSIPPANKTFLDELVNAYEIEIAEIFGNAGDGKSTVVAKFALDAIAQGKKVLFIDTERGFTKRTREKLGESYKYISNLKTLMDFCRQIPADIDLLIIDSVGYPVLTEWAKLTANEKGNSLTQIIAIKDMIKDWAINNNKVAIVTNQPDSDFGKGADYVNRPFGDKGQFVIKEVFKIERVESSPVRTKSVLKIFRSRYDARGVKVADIEITNDGVTIK